MIREGGEKAWYYRLEAVTECWTAGCLCTSDSWVNLKFSPASKWRMGMPPNPEAKSSGSRCSLSSTDQEPFLKREVSAHYLYNQCHDYKLYQFAIQGFTSFFLSSFSNWAPQNINSSCYCSGYSTNDTPVSRHLVSVKTKFCLRYSEKNFVCNVTVVNVSGYLASYLTQWDAKKQPVRKSKWNELMEPLTSPHIQYLSNQPCLLV